ncbi:MoaD/ThiS family protein [Pseudohalocynthiibacter aestuariivivens]|jgi:sulfur-carrier protein|uniref:MoaD/ThiS family protein n=1 Tax=Pseudohalocynthiibacter aestuariivivens TaxID=1591409 RepID=A0ABV5JA91_9RHOB|nr:MULTISPECIES: MoaD/ThiS family protein [Pseudohalocynthiibacter]MBS9716053.1 MoaD/ThiS family protein [Pseudohalocynthiibacter aestuariivivens]MCK0102389.1 MoaD/ThiS family protein [Pseudohalocynthiibacter sp. F2068]
MVKVKLWGSLRTLADGNEYVEVEASNFKQLLDQLSTKYPALKPQIKRGVSLALDGVIYREAWFTEISDENEIVLMPYMVGG